MFRILLIIAFTFISSSVFAQQAGEIQLYWQAEKGSEDISNLPKVAGDSLQAARIITNALNDFRSIGYLSANIDGIEMDSAKWDIQLYLGPIFSWARLDLENIDELMLRKVGYRKSDFEGKRIDPKQLSALMNKLQQENIDAGYPFTQLLLDSLQMREDGITAKINLIPGPKVYFDSLQINPSDLVKSSFLSSYLGIREGEPFNEKFFNRINNRIKRLNFLKQREAPSVTFMDDMAYPMLQLEAQKVNQVDGVLGLLPNELDPGKVLVTGQLNLDLHNLFQSGKRLGVEWQKMRPESQLLRMEYGHPNLLNSPINLDLGFYLLKEDSSFLNTDLRISLGYLAGDASQLKFIAGNQRGSLLSVGQGSEQDQFNNLADTQYSYYGVNWNMITTDDPFHPFRGWNVNVSADIGNRRILENASLPPAFYESLDLRSVKFTFQASAERFSQLSSRIILRSKFQGGWIENQQLFLNELYRLGGLNSLRGFNENFFFASQYAMLNLEPRFYLDANSYFFLFYDQAYLYYELETAKFEDSPFGIGAGVSFTTNAGIFNLAYGLGNSKLQKFEFSNSKIHIGYISRF
ncbi:hypothetical protein ACFCT7_09925 [Fulvivirgaceae bacterium LMO-SS25]